MIQQKLRVGAICYTNMWPIYYYIPQLLRNLPIEMKVHTPTEANRAIRNQQLDLGAISSFAYGQQVENLLIIPHLSVSAYGEVGSILLFHKKALTSSIHGRLALTSSSATSVHLLKIICEKFYQCKPDYAYVSGNLEEMMKHADGALLIGDDAIRAKLSHHNYQVTDLAQEWMKWTGKWITFAIWTIREAVARQVPELLKQISCVFKQAKTLALAHPIPIRVKAMREVGGSYVFWKQYFKHLCYDLNEPQISGLQLYFRYAHELGLLAKPVKLKFWNTHSFDRVTE